MSATKFLPKITVKNCGFDSDRITDLVGKNKGETAILRIAGAVQSTESKESDLGKYTVYHGQFEAIDLVGGTKFRSMKLIVPSIAEPCMDEMVSGAEAGTLVNIGLDITVEPFQPKNKQGLPYRYGVSPLVEAKGDAIEQLMQSFGDLPKSLAAPKGKK